MTTALIIAHDHLIRALYSAKESLKNAASECKTAEHDYKSWCSDPDAKFYHLEPLAAVRDAAVENYQRSEKAYDAIHAVCSKLNLL